MPQHGHGTTLSWNGQVIAELTSIGGVSLTADSFDVTSHSSATKFKEFIQGMVDAGAIPMSGFFKAADTNGQIAMLADMGALTSREVVITLPNSLATMTCTGFMSNWTLGEMTTDGAIPFSAEIKITGAPVLAVSTSTGLTDPFFALSESAVITPAASGGVYSYVATVLTGVTSITVTPTASVGVITVTANGASQVVTSGVASSAIALGVAGTNTEIKIKVQETNKAAKEYRILVARAA